MIPLAQPPWSALGKAIESRVRKALLDFALLDKEAPVSVALSGGKDSLTLLFMLKAILGRGVPKCPLFAIHVGGPFSCGASIEEEWLTKICQQLEVPFRSIVSKRPQDECYSCSRERRRLIFEAAKEMDCRIVAFGHHRDDSAQTLLMNLLHKGEFAANLPKVHMEDYDVHIIRPLIFVSEDQIRAFAKMHGFARITCQCPIGQHSMRKKVDQLLEEIEQLFPNARANIASAGLIYGSKKADLGGRKRESVVSTKRLCVES